MRGQLLGFTVDQSRYFGRKQQLNHVLSLVASKQPDTAPILLIRGPANTGKSRFVQEVCRFFHIREDFGHAILF